VLSLPIIKADITTRPENETQENTTHNYYVSKVRIRSEHCMGFLKGRWSSLRGLRIRINDEKGLQYAALWVTACIHLHAFAIDHEDMQFVNRDLFYRKGRKIARKERREYAEWRAEQELAALEDEMNAEERGEIELLEGKIKREELKKELLAYLDAQRR
jgi:DDE superfamily endonuclease